MSELSKILRSQEGGRIAFWCPGCDEAHAVNATWTFDGNVHAPTFTPSIMVTGTKLTPEGEAMIDEDIAKQVIRTGDFQYPSVDTCCHSFVRAGRIEFLGDCTHKLAGQTVSLPEWPSRGNDNG